MRWSDVSGGPWETARIFNALVLAIQTISPSAAYSQRQRDRDGNAIEHAPEDVAWLLDTIDRIRHALHEERALTEGLGSPRQEGSK